MDPLHTNNVPATPVISNATLHTHMCNVAIFIFRTKEGVLPVHDVIRKYAYTSTWLITTGLILYFTQATIVQIALLLFSLLVGSILINKSQTRRSTDLIVDTKSSLKNRSEGMEPTFTSQAKINKVQVQDNIPSHCGKLRLNIEKLKNEANDLAKIPDKLKGTLDKENPEFDNLLVQLENYIHTFITFVGFKVEKNNRLISNIEKTYALSVELNDLVDQINADNTNYQADDASQQSELDVINIGEQFSNTVKSYRNRNRETNTIDKRYGEAMSIYATSIQQFILAINKYEEDISGTLENNLQHIKSGVTRVAKIPKSKRVSLKVVNNSSR